ncbi:hypothetical protein M422DRAFT_53596 [Sphaerobolus stellatus SS14]|uniref:Uncharacterized protein n=1 Tax=Sphaerobolus stellatus (strain SS14) TaxID=990650 RepID=A0A0C9UZG7_SPHS4|nr:hypothetical protein M422DRAFT_53596 [Sphaerobolus stellatus SS14]
MRYSAYEFPDHRSSYSSDLLVNLMSHLLMSSPDEWISGSLSVASDFLEPLATCLEKNGDMLPLRTLICLASWSANIGIILLSRWEPSKNPIVQSFLRFTFQCQDVVQGHGAPISPPEWSKVREQALEYFLSMPLPNPQVISDAHRLFTLTRNSSHRNLDDGYLDFLMHAMKSTELSVEVRNRSIQISSTVIREIVSLQAEERKTQFLKTMFHAFPNGSLFDKSEEIEKTYFRLIIAMLQTPGSTDMLISSGKIRYHLSLLPSITKMDDFETNAREYASFIVTFQTQVIFPHYMAYSSKKNGETLISLWMMMDNIYREYSKMDRSIWDRTAAVLATYSLENWKTLVAADLIHKLKRLVQVSLNANSPSCVDTSDLQKPWSIMRELLDDIEAYQCPNTSNS